VRRLGRPADAVARPGVDASFADPALRLPPGPRPPGLLALGLGAPYLLAVATLEPRKNLGALLQAFVALKREGRLPAEWRLALIGAPGWGTQTLRQALADAAPWGVVSTGYVDDALLPQLYRHAEMLVFPSLYEGFGMPVIEARACGTPVVVSDVPELREAAGEDGVVVAPTAEGIAAGILRARQQPRPSPVGVAAQHSWAEAARVMAQLLLARRTAGAAGDPPA
jgi:glycosyltransferase involved in cell wall biosynthesis